MLKPTDKTVLVSHKGCLDGTGSAWMFLEAGGRIERIIFRNPSMLVFSPGELPADADEVWYADCCPPDLTDPTCGIPFRVFDHHMTNQAKFKDDPRCTFVMERSGTSLMSQVLGVSRDSEGNYLTTGMSSLIQALEAYDLGNFDNEIGMYLSDLAASYSQQEMLSLLFIKNSHVLYDAVLLARVEAARAIRDQYAAGAGARAHYFEFKPPGWGNASGTVNAGVISSPVYWKNAVAEEILKKAEVAIIIDPVGGMVSLRSHTIDVSAIAVAMGGGGHKRAAGFKLNLHSLMNAVIDEVFG